MRSISSMPPNGAHSRAIVLPSTLQSISSREARAGALRVSSRISMMCFAIVARLTAKREDELAARTTHASVTSVREKPTGARHTQIVRRCAHLTVQKQGIAAWLTNRCWWRRRNIEFDQASGLPTRPPCAAPPRTREAAWYHEHVATGRHVFASGTQRARCRARAGRETPSPASCAVGRPSTRKASYGTTGFALWAA